MKVKLKDIWTIGHSTRSMEEFVAMLRSFNITFLADIRSFPGSKRYPHFNKQNLEKKLPGDGISYIHMPDLGGRRKPREDSKNNAWRHASFKGYADHMETAIFKNAIDELQSLALQNNAAYMCSESLWWKCHRALVSDYLKIRGWNVIHITDVDKSTEHPYSSPARIVQGNLFYNTENE